MPDIVVDQIERERAKVGEVDFVRPPWLTAWLHGLFCSLAGAGRAMLRRCICRDASQLTALDGLVKLTPCRRRACCFSQLAMCGKNFECPHRLLERTQNSRFSAVVYATYDASQCVRGSPDFKPNFVQTTSRALAQMLDHESTIREVAPVRFKAQQLHGCFCLQGRGSREAEIGYLHTNSHRRLPV